MYLYIIISEQGNNDDRSCSTDRVCMCPRLYERSTRTTEGIYSYTTGWVIRIT